MKAFHITGTLLAIHIPIAFCGLMPDMVQSLADDGLAVLLPLHGFIGMNFVITDYVPKGVRGITRLIAGGSMLLAFAGMYKLNMGENPGLSGTVKQLWMDKKVEAPN